MISDAGQIPGLRAPGFPRSGWGSFGCSEEREVASAGIGPAVVGAAAVVRVLEVGVQGRGAVRVVGAVEGGGGEELHVCACRSHQDGVQNGLEKHGGRSCDCSVLLMGASWG